MIGSRTAGTPIVAAPERAALRTGCPDLPRDAHVSRDTGRRQGPMCHVRRSRSRTVVGMRCPATRFRGRGTAGPRRVMSRGVAARRRQVLARRAAGARPASRTTAAGDRRWGIRDVRMVRIFTAHRRTELLGARRVLCRLRAGQDRRSRCRGGQDPCPAAGLRKTQTGEPSTSRTRPTRLSVLEQTDREAAIATPSDSTRPRFTGDSFRTLQHVRIWACIYEWLRRDRVRVTQARINGTFGPALAAGGRGNATVSPSGRRRTYRPFRQPEEAYHDRAEFRR